MKKNNDLFLGLLLLLGLALAAKKKPTVKKPIIRQPAPPIERRETDINISGFSKGIIY